jgi:predicted enzyme related to lactoylglutathione lyase
MAGQMVHVEIPADDTAGSQAFWGSLFGWEFNSFPGPSEYLMTRLGEAQGAAITNMEPGKRGPRVYFDVDDIKDGASKVAELGGKAGEPMPVPGMGWFAVCSDPHGNDFGLWQTDEQAPMPS